MDEGGAKKNSTKALGRACESTEYVHMCDLRDLDTVWEVSICFRRQKGPCSIPTII